MRATLWMPRLNGLGLETGRDVHEVVAGHREQAGSVGDAGAGEVLGQAGVADHHWTVGRRGADEARVGIAVDGDDGDAELVQQAADAVADRPEAGDDDMTLHARRSPVHARRHALLGGDRGEMGKEDTDESADRHHEHEPEELLPRIGTGDTGVPPGRRDREVEGFERAELAGDTEGDAAAEQQHPQGDGGRRQQRRRDRPRREGVLGFVDDHRTARLVGRRSLEAGCSRGRRRTHPRRRPPITTSSPGSSAASPSSLTFQPSGPPRASTRTPWAACTAPGPVPANGPAVPTVARTSGISSRPRRNVWSVSSPRAAATKAGAARPDRLNARRTLEDSSELVGHGGVEGAQDDRHVGPDAGRAGDRSKVVEVVLAQGQESVGARQPGSSERGGAVATADGDRRHLTDLRDEVVVAPCVDDDGDAPAELDQLLGDPDSQPREPGHDVARHGRVSSPLRRRRRCWAGLMPRTRLNAALRAKALP